MLLKGNDISQKNVTNYSTRSSFKFLAEWCKKEIKLSNYNLHKIEIKWAKVLLCIWILDRYFTEKYFSLYIENRVQKQSSI